MRVDTLQAVSDVRLDVNMNTTGNTYDSPLFKVMNFASKENVGEMRRLLMKVGAIEQEGARERWSLHCYANYSKIACMRYFHNDPC